LYLHVTGRRADGYHGLESLIVFAQLGDTVEVEACDDLILGIDGPFANALPADQENLVWQAALLLAQAAGIRAQARIRLHKLLPVAAGIGGGSADAAAALMALRALWQLPMDDAGLHDLAADLGADVPVCLGARPSIVTGIGHDVLPVPPLPMFALVLVNPLQHLSTTAVFRELQPPFTPSQPWSELPAAPQSTVRDLTQALSRRHNDLEVPARRLAPVVGEVLMALAGLPGCGLARMSGSGATCFGLFDDLAEAEAAARALGAARTDWWVQASAIEGVGRQCGEA
jgi:4-diphosphocytidyl-2-C-methyl-D-erythritol kinase